ncbi:hypothetical protein [Streptomyces sp. NPDC001833]|uniref:hypothetical protein n=1 Tax=Streptomyces sp. NPDC001833 TaxID=3154658 RepID=UPI00332589DC
MPCATDELVLIHGELRARVTVLSGEFGPDLVGGTLHGGRLLGRIDEGLPGVLG